MNRKNLQILPKRLQAEFEKIFAQKRLSLEIPALKTSFEKLGSMSNYETGLATKEVDEVSSLIVSEQSEHGVVSEDFLFLFWPGRSASSDGYLMLTRDVASAFENGFLGEPISRAEANLTLHLLFGYALQDRSPLRSTTYETNRSCLKNVFEKLSIADQTSLISQSFAKLAFALTSGPQASDTGETIVELLSKSGFADFTYYPINLRGYELGCIQLGPSAGRPVFLHPATRLPFFSSDHLAVLQSSNIRLFMLLRPGCLSQSPAPKSIGVAQDVIGDALGFVSSLVATGERVTVVGHANGCVHAVASASAIKNLKHLVLFLPTSKKSGGASVYARLLKSILNISKSSDRLLSAYVTAYLEMVRNEWVFEKIGRHLHSDKGSDSREVSKELSDPILRNFFKDVYLGSKSSIILDAKAGLEIDWHRFRNTDAKKTVFYGQTEDIKTEFGANTDVIHLEGIYQYANAKAWSNFFLKLGSII